MTALRHEVTGRPGAAAVVQKSAPVSRRALTGTGSWAGPDVEVLASIEAKGESRPVVVRQGHLLATSFHPEVTGDHRVHALFVEMVRRAA